MPNPISHLHIGNVVRLRSGGPNMTVEQEPGRADDGSVHCVWMDHTGQAQRTELPRRTLERIKI
jgi:uncharacterized protein YodC (DUF2158 family)